MMTIPESEETIEAQLEWLREGKRKAVLIPSGSSIPQLGLGFYALVLVDGILLYRRGIDILPFQNGDIELSDLLGYGVSEKPRFATDVLTVRGPNGHEKQSVVIDDATEPAARVAASKVASSDDTIQREPAERVIADRLRSLDAKELKVRPVRPEDIEALDAAAAADAHYPLNPTHLIERGGEIIGYLGVNSLPLYRLWFHSQKVRAGDSLRVLWHVEQNFRNAGAQTIGTIINTGSPFYPVAVRGGYLESANDRLFLKEL